MGLRQAARYTARRRACTTVGRRRDVVRGSGRRGSAARVTVTRARGGGILPVGFAPFVFQLDTPPSSLPPNAGTRTRLGLTAHGFLTFSNGAVGNGRDWAGLAGSREAKKPDKITLFGSGRDCPEPPSIGSNPAGATKKLIFHKGFRDAFRLRATDVQQRSPLLSLADELSGLAGEPSAWAKTWPSFEKI
jgi:hypothetical protein